MSTSTATTKALLLNGKLVTINGTPAILPSSADTNSGQVTYAPAKSN